MSKDLKTVVLESVRLFSNSSGGVTLFIVAIDLTIDFPREMFLQFRDKVAAKAAELEATDTEPRTLQ